MTGVKRRIVGVAASMGAKLTRSLPWCERSGHKSAMHRQYQCRWPCPVRDLRCPGAAKNAPQAVVVNSSDGSA
jgi:hypothetical protein